MSQKIQSSFKNMVISLFLITFVSGISLGGIQKITQKPIEESQKQKETEAISAVLPEFDNNPLETKQEFENVEIYTATKSGKIVGYAILSSTNSGFGGNVQVMIGFLPNGNIYNTSVVAHQETPGLGDKITGEKFRSQFKGFNCNTQKAFVKKDNGDIDALTAATISSRAFCSTIRIANEAFLKFTKQESKIDAESGATK